MAPLVLPPDLLGLFMRSMSPAETAVFLELQLVRGRTLVLGSGVISPLALGASQCNDLSHDVPLYFIKRQRSSIPEERTPFGFWVFPGLGYSDFYSRISEMTPAPTVRPPSRIANRNSFSIAIGVINCTSILTLSPGITISTPEGNVTTPVTSVVRK